MTAPLHTVHVRVNDAATGQPTPVRIRFVDSAGQYLAPFGRLRAFATEVGEDVGGSAGQGGEACCFIDGSCEVQLPADPVRVAIHKGPEYTPIQREVTLGPGKLALRFTIERWTDLRQQGWYSGESRAHFLTPHAALLEAAAEDLACVNLLALEWEHGGRPALPNILAFSGQRAALEMPGHCVVVNTLNTHPVLGRLGLLNCHRVVHPLRFGKPVGPDNWALADWCDQCHRKGGLVVWVSSPGRDGSDELGGEALADLILGKIDALEVTQLHWCRERHADWYGLLNCGLRVPLIGGSGKASNRRVLGEVRTYAHLQPGQEFSYADWIEAVRLGRTFVTNGPLLTFTVAGQEPGAVVEVPEERTTVHVHAEARSAVPFDRLEIVADGAAVAGVESDAARTSALLDAELPVPASGWMAARCWGEQRSAAHTSPIYVQATGRPPTIDLIRLAALLEHLDRMRAWVDRDAQFENERQRAHLAGIFDQARQALLRRAGG